MGSSPTFVSYRNPDCVLIARPTKAPRGARRGVLIDGLVRLGGPQTYVLPDPPKVQGNLGICAHARPTRLRPPFEWRTPTSNIIAALDDLLDGDADVLVGGPWPNHARARLRRPKRERPRPESVGNILFLGCTAVSTMTRLRVGRFDRLGLAGDRKLSCSNACSFSSPLRWRQRQRVSEERSNTRRCWKNSSPQRTDNRGSPANARTTPHRRDRRCA
jgi:hypothetical protein